MKLQIQKGTTSKIVEVLILDSSSTVGAGLTGVAFGDITAYYTLNGAAGAATVHTPATMTIGTWASGGFIEKDAANMPGIYQLGVFDAALTGADSSVIMLKGATNMVPVVLEIELVGYDPNDAVRLGLTALPNVNAGSAGGVATDTDANGAVRIVDGTGARELNTASGAVVSVTTVTGNVDGNVSGSVASVVGHTAQTGDNFARLGVPAGASVSADVAAAKVDTAAIKLQTDKMAFTVTNRIDAQLIGIKAKTITGTGTAGDEYDVV